MLAVFAGIILVTNQVQAGSIRLNSLNFQIQLNEDGSMDVIENWNARITDTNTMFKDFYLDSSKFKEITKTKRFLNRKIDEFEDDDLEYSSEDDQSIKSILIEIRDDVKNVNDKVEDIDENVHDIKETTDDINETVQDIDYKMDQFLLKFDEYHKEKHQGP